MRERSYALVRLDTLSHGITTFSGLLPFISPPSEQAKQSCIDQAYKEVRESLANRGLYCEDEEWCYENFDAFEKALGELTNEELQRYKDDIFEALVMSERREG